MCLARKVLGRVHVSGKVLTRNLLFMAKRSTLLSLIRMVSNSVLLCNLLGVTVMSITIVVNILILLVVAWLVCHLPGITSRRIPSVRILPDVS